MEHRGWQSNEHTGTMVAKSCVPAELNMELNRICGPMRR